MLLRRFYSYFIDFFLISLGNKLFMLIYSEFITNHFALLGTSVHRKLVYNLYHLHFINLFLVFWGYFFLCQYLGDGKTFGKLCTGLKTISRNPDTASLSFQECFMRTLGHFLCMAMGMLPYCFVLLRKDYRGIPDFLGNSQVVCEKKHQIKLELDREKEYFNSPALIKWRKSS